eukprot:g2492.t1
MDDEDLQVDYEQSSEEEAPAAADSDAMEAEPASVGPEGAVSIGVDSDSAGHCYHPIVAVERNGEDLVRARAQLCDAISNAAGQMLEEASAEQKELAKAAVGRYATAMEAANELERVQSRAEALQQEADEKAAAARAAARAARDAADALADANRTVSRTKNEADRAELAALQADDSISAIRQQLQLSTGGITPA